MSIDMYLGSSDQQASSVGKVLQQRITAYKSLQRALEQLVSSSPDLSGHTYVSAKRYSEQVLIPLMRGCILLDEAIKEACTAFPNDYRRQVDSVDLKESELVDQISRSDRIIGRYVELIDLEYRQELPNYSYIANLKSGESNQRQVKRKLEEKLLKLREFDSNSRHLFSSIAALAEAVNTGIRQTKTSWNGTSQTFTLPRALDLEWTKVVEKRWTQREEKASKLKLQQAAEKLSRETGIKYEDAYRFVMDGVLSDENKNKIKSVKKLVKYTKGGLYIVSSGRYYWKHSGKHYWKNTPNKTWNIWKASKNDPNFDKGGIKGKHFSKKGARYTDLPGIKQLKKSETVQSLISKISKDNQGKLTKVGKGLKKVDKELSNISSKLKSYEHGRLNRDLKMMKENNLGKSLGKFGKVGKAASKVLKFAGKGLKVAGWVGAAINVKDSVETYKKKGYSNEQTAALTARKVAVDTATTVVGSNIGRVTGAVIGQAVIPIPGVGAAIGSVAGSILGAMAGSWIGSTINDNLDKNVKPKQSGRSLAW
ncbi:T7SS effector LXG polymorphic toxin [Streptococcus equi]|uniref:T7SS effector LXG polymorphic toxin n=1 Tax=Streptococcus equi TaxID=1336 RepID=UPI001E56B717|nr:T7SS effector LXG polymorphic toxin [Streptococcus equi]